MNAALSGTRGRGKFVRAGFTEEDLRGIDQDIKAPWLACVVVVAVLVTCVGVVLICLGYIGIKGEKRSPESRLAFKVIGPATSLAGLLAIGAGCTYASRIKNAKVKEALKKKKLEREASKLQNMTAPSGPTQLITPQVAARHPTLRNTVDDAPLCEPLLAAPQNNHTPEPEVVEPPQVMPSIEVTMPTPSKSIGESADDVEDKEATLSAFFHSSGSSGSVTRVTRVVYAEDL